MTEKTTLPVTDNESPEARALREAKATLAAARAARDVARAPARVKVELERLERQIRDEAALAAAQDEHGEENVRAVTSESGLVIVKRDHHLKFKQFMDKGKFTTAVLEEQIARCLVHPTPDELDAYIEKEPFLLQSVSGAIAVLAGARSDEFTGK